MPQCPLCKRNAQVEDGRCRRCQGDLTALQTVRDLPAHFYNAGLEAARHGDSLSAMLKAAAASQLGERPEPWVVLGKLFANDGAEDYAQACFAQAQRLGATVPAGWIPSNGAQRTAERNDAHPTGGLQAEEELERGELTDAIPRMLTGGVTSAEKPGATKTKAPVSELPGRAGIAPLAARLGLPPAVARWTLMGVLLATASGMGWQVRGYWDETITAIPARQEQVMPPHRTASADSGETALLTPPLVTALPVSTQPDHAEPITVPPPDREEPAWLERSETDVASQPVQGESLPPDKVSATSTTAFSDEPEAGHQVSSLDPPQPASVSAGPVPIPEPPTEPARYIVRPGDSLWRIAQSRLGAGQRWRTLYEANHRHIDGPGRLVVGQVLVIPSVSE